MKRFKSHCVDKQTNKLTYTRVTDSNENKTNSQRSKQSKPLVYQSSHVYTKSVEYTKPSQSHRCASPKCSVRSSASLCQFRRQLKTYLFVKAAAPSDTCF